VSPSILPKFTYILSLISLAIPQQCTLLATRTRLSFALYSYKNREFFQKITVIQYQYEIIIVIPAPDTEIQYAKQKQNNRRIASYITTSSS